MPRIGASHSHASSVGAQAAATKEPELTSINGDTSSTGSQRHHNSPKRRKTSHTNTEASERRSRSRSRESLHSPAVSSTNSPSRNGPGSESGEDNSCAEATASRPNDEAPPPLPDEPPPLPNAQPPSEQDSAADDGWEPLWDAKANAYYFYNRFTQLTQWENPRVAASEPNATPGNTTGDVAAASGIANGSSDDTCSAAAPPLPPQRPHGGYNPAIHGSYDPSAPYALEAAAQEQAEAESAASAHAAALSAAAAIVAGRIPGDNGHRPTDGPPQDGGEDYTAVGQFNRFTGRWQNAGLTPELYGDEAKSARQMGAFFDVDAAANSHDGRSLRAERAGKKLSKKEVRAFRDKRREKKEEKRRAWLRD